jgi:hypothetical protein
MAPSPIRRRATQAMALVALLGLGPVVVRELWPSVANYVPPPMLLLLIALSALLALAAWRTEWIVTVLFGHASERIAKVGNELHRLRVSAAIGLFVTVVLIALWVKSLL